MNRLNILVHARASQFTPRPRLGTILAAVAVVALLCFGGTACSQAQPSALQEVQRVKLQQPQTPEDTKLTELQELSPISLAWSPDGKRLAFATYSRLPVGVVDLQTQQRVAIAPPRPNAPPWPKLKAIHWSVKLNRLVLVQDVTFSVYDMTQAEPRLLYTVENKFPRLLSAEASALVPQGDDDYLVLAGDTTWRVDPTNPQVVAYSLKTGERKLAFQFDNPPVNMLSEGSPSMRPAPNAPIAAGLAANGDILVTVSATRRIDPFITYANGAKQVNERVTWTVNLSRGQITCKFPVRQDDYSDPTGTIIMARSARPIASGNSTQLVVDNSSGYWRDRGAARGYKLTIHDPEYNHNEITRYDMATCDRLPQQLQGPIRGNDFVTSPDGRWLFADAPYTTHPSHAPFQLWRAADGALLHNGTWQFDGGVTTAAFSQDGKYLAWGKSNELIIYRIAVPAR